MEIPTLIHHFLRLFHTHLPGPRTTFSLPSRTSPHSTPHRFVIHFYIFETQRAPLQLRKVTPEGEILPMYQYDVNVGFDDGCDRIFLVWPQTICHEIDEDSPFWNVTPDDLYKDDFELVVILEGLTVCSFT